MSKKDDLFEGVEDIQSIAGTDTSPRDVILENAPSMVSPEWQDYVLTLFTETEKFDGRPKAVGLRRVAEIVRGRIVSSIPVQVFPPTDGSHRATTVWRVEFSDGTIFGDVADCNDDNTDDGFIPFAMATSATRAEVRALRKALNIATAAAEEMTSKDTAEIVRSKVSTKDVSGEISDADRMTDNQCRFISVKCEQMNINAVKFFKESLGLNAKGKITKKQASNAIDKLDDYQKDISNIPAKLLGYDEGWRDAS